MFSEKMSEVNIQSTIKESELNPRKENVIEIIACEI